MSGFIILIDQGSVPETVPGELTDDRILDLIERASTGAWGDCAITEAEHDRIIAWIAGL